MWQRIAPRPRKGVSYERTILLWINIIIIIIIIIIIMFYKEVENEVNENSATIN